MAKSCGTTQPGADRFSYRSADALRECLKKALAGLAQEGGSSTHPTRLLVMTEPRSIDANEITDKGYMNQRADLERRAILVKKLYAGGGDFIVA